MGLASQPKFRLDTGDGRVLDLHLQDVTIIQTQTPSSAQPCNQTVTHSQSQSEGLTDNKTTSSSGLPHDLAAVRVGKLAKSELVHGIWILLLAWRKDKEGSEHRCPQGLIGCIAR